MTAGSIDSSKVFVLYFRLQVGSWFRTRAKQKQKKQKNKENLTAKSCTCELDPEVWLCDTIRPSLGLGISEPLKQLGSSLGWNLSLKKLPAWRHATLLKTDSNTDVFLWKFLRAACFTEHLRWLLLTVLPQYGKVRWGVCSLIFSLYVFNLNAKLLYK